MVKAKARGVVSKQMDTLLGRPPVPQSVISRAKYSEKEDNLLNVKVKLDQREKDINKKESDIKKEIKELEKQIKVIKKERATVWSDLDRLKGEKTKLFGLVRDLHTELKGHRRELKDAHHVHTLLNKKQKSFTKKENEIKEREKAVTKKEKHVHYLNDKIKTKEHELHRVSKLTIVEKEEFEKKKKSLLGDLDELDKKRILLTAEVKYLKSEFSEESKRLKQAMKDVKELYSAAENKNKALDRRSLDVDKEIQKKQMAFMKDIENKLNGLERKEEKLNRYAVDLDKKELDLRKTFIKEELNKATEKGIYCIKQEDVRNGIDYKLTSAQFVRRLGKSLINKFGGELKETTRLVTRDNQTGKDLHRVSVLFRIPKFKKGDIVFYKSKEVKILNFGKKVFVVDVKTNKKQQVPYHRIK